MRAVVLSALFAAALAAYPRNAIAAETVSKGGVTASLDREQGRVLLSSGRLALVVETRGGLNAASLRDERADITYADADYVWPGGEAPALAGTPEVAERADGRVSIALNARLGALDVRQELWGDPKFPDGIFETLTITNRGAAKLASPDLRMGFAKAVRRGSSWTADAEEVRFCGIPYRRDTDGLVRDFPLKKVVEEPSSYLCWFEPPHATPTWGSEGWVLASGGASLVVAKFAPNAMEWSLLTPVARAGGETVVCFGGAGVWKKRSPQAAARLAPGESFTFGETLYQAVEGDWKAGYYAYRRYAESKGCRPRPGYDPPVHWNELYDNRYFFEINAKLPPVDSPALAPFLAKDNRELLRDLYSPELMKAEAAKAEEMGCEALYLDPGWDTGPSHHVWDAERLGSIGSSAAPGIPPW